MVELYWPRETQFVDFQTDDRYMGSGVYDVPDHLEDYYRTRGWEDPPEDYEGEVGESEPARDTNRQGPTRSEMVPEEADDEDDGGDSGN